MARREKLTKQPIPGTFGGLLLSARRKRGLAIRECAINVGLSPTYLAYIETGQRTPDPNRVPDIAVVYDVSPEVLAWSWISSFAAALIPYLHRSPLEVEELYSMLLENAQLARKRIEQSLRAKVKDLAPVDRDSVAEAHPTHRVDE
ncbi:MAG: helix-turn-helix transcriptional regulator [Bryobacteraceae bacterium]|jgi:transcriptional regulator with XRE-family HTH domain